ncbi:MAG: DUF3300 domain-containing protein [Pseudomonadota bacterium]
MKHKFLSLLATFVFLWSLNASTAWTQETEYQPLTPQELEELVGAIALYPDDLVGVVLPASTYPLQVVQAARYLKDLEADSSLKPNEDWDDTVIALLNYPEVLDLLNDDVDWTWRLGQAVINQEPDLVAAIDAFRERAYKAGNLRSDEHQVVKRNDDGNLVIERVDPEVIYVPNYEPKEVVVYQTRPVYRYYTRAYPVYYYPYPVDYYFPGRFWGVSSFYGWRPYGGLRVHHYGYASHPFFGYTYYTNHYYFRHHHRRYRHRYVDSHSHGSYRNRGYRGDRWRPNRRQVGDRPFTVNSEGRQRFRNGSNSVRQRDAVRKPSPRSDGRFARKPNNANSSRFTGADTSNASRSNRTARTNNRKPSTTASTRFRGTDNRGARQARANTGTRSVTRSGTQRKPAAQGSRSNASRFKPNTQRRASTKPNTRTTRQVTRTNNRSSQQTRARVTQRKPSNVRRSSPQRQSSAKPSNRVRQAPRSNARSNRGTSARSKPAPASRSSRPSNSNKGSSRSGSRGNRDSGGSRSRRVR